MITTANAEEREGRPTIRRVGLEQEFFLVDEVGNVCRTADPFLLWCRSEAETAGLDPACFKEECATGMVELTTPPSADFSSLAASYLENLRLALGVGRELGVRLYPLGTYPLRMTPELRYDLRYQLQAQTVGRRRFLHAARCAGTHLHLEAPPGTIWPDPKVARVASAAAREEMVDLYNLATALDPALVAITRSCPFYEGHLERFAARTARYRGGLGLDGVYTDLPQVGALQPYARDAEALISRERERYGAWYRAMDEAGVDRRLYARTDGDRHRASRNPVRLNPAGTVEIRSMDSNQPEVVLAVCATAIAAAERVRHEGLRVAPSPEARRLRVRDGELLVPDFDHLTSSLLPRAVRYGAAAPDVADYLDSLVDFSLPYSEGTWSIARLRQPSGDYATTEGEILKGMDPLKTTLSREEGLELVREACDELEGWVALLCGRFRFSRRSASMTSANEVSRLDTATRAVGRADTLPSPTGLEGASAG